MKNYIKTLLSFLPFIEDGISKSEQGETFKLINPPEMLEWTNAPIVPRHNNRKTTRGRYTQYIPLNNGQFRAIYHGAKS